jgi:hypothetical protein
MKKSAKDKASHLDRYSLVDMRTCYGLDTPGIETRWGRSFPQLSRQFQGKTTLIYKGYLVITGIKQPGRGVNIPPTLVLRLKKE